MRRGVLAVVGGAVLLASCGGSDGSESGTVQVASGTTIPTPTVTPTPTPTPTSAPISSYTPYASLAGDQTFKTACASLILGTGLPTPQPAASFGDSLILGHTAATGAWSVNGDSVALSFAASDAIAAPAGQTVYQHAAAGSVQQLAITAPVASDTTLNYTRSLSLLVDRTAGRTLYSCVFGVPSQVVDVPSVAVSYAKVSISGTAYVLDQTGTVQTYVLSGSAGTLAFDPGTGAVSMKLTLFGNLQTATGTSTTSMALGSYTGSATVDSARVRFNGSLDSTDRVSQFSSFSGAFFGGTESGSAFEILAADTSTGNRIAIVGALNASR